MAGYEGMTFIMRLLSRFRQYRMKKGAECRYSRVWQLEMIPLWPKIGEVTFSIVGGLNVLMKVSNSGDQHQGAQSTLKLVPASCTTVSIALASILCMSIVCSRMSSWIFLSP